VIHAANDVEVLEGGHPSRRIPLLMVDLLVSEDGQTLVYSTSVEDVVAALKRILAHALSVTQVVTPVLLVFLAAFLSAWHEDAEQ
jgi:hypothetical protein